ncbi:MAG: hypothetical protein ACJAWW_000386 [Sulfurimonas sp.]|jgi:hypothetical protein
MKKILLIVFLTINLYADKNWIKIESADKPKPIISSNKLNLNASQMKPINNIIKSATIIKQLIDAKQIEESKNKSKNWFTLKK